jgi:uncharacterized protein
MKRSSKVVLLSCLALSVYLTAEAFLPAASQPTARLGVALLHGYQATASPALQSAGVRCRYAPSCSHYAVDAISHYGTMSGVLRTAGRLWRCSPWGGSGYDPAFDEEQRYAAYIAPEPQEQETPEQKRAREQAKQEWEKFKKEVGPEAGAAAAACGLGCVLTIITAVVGLAIHIFMMVYAFKDAKARGDQNAVLWLVLIFFFPLVGFIVYFVVRPKGELNPCPNCHNRKLEILTKCPHCGTELVSGPPKPPVA